MIKKKILIATGGTGGHVFPAYSLLKYLNKNNYNVVLTSDNRGLNYLKYYKDFTFLKIPSSPLNKKNLFKFFFSITNIFYSILKSLYFLSNEKPSLVIGTGGYSSFPVCIAATILRIKFVIYENNLIIGKANKFLLPFAKKIFVSNRELEGISKKYDKKVFETGNLVREEIINFNAIDDEKEKFNDIKILVLGGSQAAKIFALKLPQIFKRLKKTNPSIKIYQQCQKEQIHELSEFYKKEKIENEVFNFTNKIIDYYHKANLVITRSGASVLGELININMPFISIPLPTSADNHQFKNAEFCLRKGLGYLLEEKKIEEKLQDLIISIFKDKSLLKNIVSNQRQYSDKNIFKNLTLQIEKIINEKN